MHGQLVTKLQTFKDTLRRGLHACVSWTVFAINAIGLSALAPPYPFNTNEYNRVASIIKYLSLSILSFSRLLINANSLVQNIDEAAGELRQSAISRNVIAIEAPVSKPSTIR